MTHSKALKVLFALSFALSLTVSGAARGSEPASPQGAVELVEVLGQVAIWASEIENRSEKKGALRSLIRVGFDLDVISQFVLGKFWNRAKAVQRAEFKDLFTEYLVNLFANHFNRIGALTVVASNRVAGGDFLVRTIIDRATDTAKVVWRVRAWDNEYRIIDILIDGISLALTHRSEFVSVIRRDGFEKLMQTLRKRTPTITDFAHQLTRSEWLILAAALLFNSASPASSDADKAFRDFERGDYRLALKGWTVLANQGDAEGQYFLGHFYAEGLGAPQDYARAAFWFAESASQGYSHGQFALGYLYEHGWGVSKDHSNALKWYRLAADQGLALAHNNVGLMYEEGHGVRQDYAEAHMRYSLAISLSNPNPSTAIQNLNSLIKKMTPAQTAQAKRLAREWRQEYLR